MCGEFANPHCCKDCTWGCIQQINSLNDQQLWALGTLLLLASRGRHNSSPKNSIALEEKVLTMQLQRQCQQWLHNEHYHSNQKLTSFNRDNPDCYCKKSLVQLLSELFVNNLNRKITTWNSVTFFILIITKNGWDFRNQTNNLHNVYFFH